MCLEGGAIGVQGLGVRVDTAGARLVMNEASISEACAKGSIAPRVQDVSCATEEEGAGSQKCICNDADTFFNTRGVRDRAKQHRRHC